MEEAARKLAEMEGRVRDAWKKRGGDASEPVIVGACKGQSPEVIETFLRAGLRHCGENYVQEAAAKWPALRARHPGAVLHMIGALQSSKAAEAVALFDAIDTVDREKIAAAIAKESAKQDRKPRCLIQVNIGMEAGKAGVDSRTLPDFLAFCRNDCGLRVDGLMCIPPAGEPPAPYFALMATWAQRLGLTTLSMGMSADFAEAIRFGATHVRVGTALFGERK